MALSNEDKYEWAHMPGTQAFFATLKESLEDTKNAWAAEKFVCGTAELTMQHNATALGGVRVLTDIIEQITDAMAKPEEQ